MINESNKRSNYFIYPRFQVRFIVIVNLVTLVFLALVGAFLFSLFQNLYDFGVSTGLNYDHEYFQYLIHIRKNTLASYLGTSLLFLIGTITFSILYSHKIAAPIFKIYTVLNQVANKERPKPLKLRKNDVFKELEVPINTIIGKNQD